ncbi:hypothetical protein CEXT_249161 [Caerostris extrusa]|uniref:Uncharacterized protein n=1 Tax=Caerostris extrusa TaxID=172846 RepID=A0AAV4VC45_CAEEX|nr:hypothetical protein CEXT_249161 [Caerostris extrusa]
MTKKPLFNDGSSKTIHFFNEHQVSLSDAPEVGRKLTSQPSLRNALLWGRGGRPFFEVRSEGWFHGKVYAALPLLLAAFNEELQKSKGSRRRGTFEAV